MLVITLRAMLPRVVGSLPAITLPAIVPSIDSELSYTTSTLGVTLPERNSGYWARFRYPGKPAPSASTGASAAAQNSGTAIRRFMVDQCFRKMDCATTRVSARPPVAYTVVR